MDTNDLRVAFTLVTFVTFLGILWWAFSGQRKQAFDEAAQLPFTEDEVEPGAAVRQDVASSARHQ